MLIDYPNEQQSNEQNYGIDELLYQNVIKKLSCSPQQEKRSIVLPDNDSNENIFESYDNGLNDPSNNWMYWLILILVIVLLYYLYHKYKSTGLSAETVRATILGYQP